MRFSSRFLLPAPRAQSTNHSTTRAPAVQGASTMNADICTTHTAHFSVPYPTTRSRATCKRGTGDHSVSLGPPVRPLQVEAGCLEGFDTPSPLLPMLPMACDAATWLFPGGHPTMSAPHERAGSQGAQSLSDPGNASPAARSSQCRSLHSPRGSRNPAEAREADIPLAVAGP